MTYNTPIPPQIMTPDTVETRLGTLNFVDGIPTAATTQLVYDNLDFIRGTEVFLNFIPACSIEAIRLSFIERGAGKSNQAILFADLCDSNPLLLTANTDTVYCIALLDLEADGPTVVEIPPRCGPGTVNDAFFRFVVDMGTPGPDRAQAAVPDRARLVRGRAAQGQDGRRRLFYCPLPVQSKRPDPPRLPGGRQARRRRADVPHGAQNLSAGRRGAPAADGVRQRLGRIVQHDPRQRLRVLHGTRPRHPVRAARTLRPRTPRPCRRHRDQKGQKFAPDPRMRTILTDAVAVGNATARAIAFRNRDPRAPLYPNSQWQTGFIGNDYRWLDGDGLGGRNLDARTRFFYMATVNTPAMALEMVGVGSQYAIISAAKDGGDLDGAKSTSGLTSLPTPPPRTSGRSSSMTRRPAPSCRRRSRSPAGTTGATN